MHLFWQTHHHVTFVYIFLKFTEIISGIWPGSNFIILFEVQAIGLGFTGGRIPGGRVKEHVPQLLVARSMADSFMDEVEEISQKYSEKSKKRDDQKGFD